MTKQVETIPVFNTLGARASTPGGRSFEELVEAAEAAVQDLRGNYVAERAKSMARLADLAKALIADPAAAATRAEIYQIAHDMKGQGTTFGYELVTDLAGALCDLMEGFKDATPDGAAVQAIDTHVNALGVVVSRNVQGAGGRQGADLLAGLRKIAARATAAT